ncbi:MAG: nuclear transport factor 2 family protein [Solirubrobacterales bacterium]
MRPDAELLEHLLQSFFDSFDDHDWQAMRSMLADQLMIDYSTLRGGEPGLSPITADEYVAQREQSLAKLMTTHEFSALEGQVDGATATATCNFDIRRYSADGLRHFHTKGDYLFGFVREDEHWLIVEITQNTVERDGDPDLHSPS